MNNNERYIDDLFDRLREAEPVVSFSQTRALVDDFTPEHQSTDIRSRSIMISTIALVIAGLTLLTLPQDRPAVPEPDAPPVLLHEAITGSAESRPDDPEATDGRSDGIEGDMRGVAEREGNRDGVDPVETIPTAIGDIDGIATLRLDLPTLARLGILPDTNGVRVFQTGGGGITGMLLHIGGTTFNPDASGTLPAGIRPLDESALKIRSVTSDEGLERVAIYEDDDPHYLDQERRIRAVIDSAEKGLLDPEAVEKRMEQVYAEENARMAIERSSGRYVPVLVHAAEVVGPPPAEGEFSWSPHIIVWFEPTPEFLAALPEEMRRQVEDQLRWSTILRDKRIDETIDAFIDRWNQAGEELPSGISDDAVSGDLLGLAGSASGAITNAGISPNPARGSARVYYGLAAPRNVTVTLHDLQGKHLRTLHDTSPSTASLNVATIDLQGLTPGIYLVAISTSRERVVQRLVVSR